MLYAGIDAGSNTIKVVILGANGVVCSNVIKTGMGGDDQALRCMEEACDKVGIDRGEIVHTYCTGYGREYLSFPQGRRSEIICHAAGVHWVLPDVRTIVD